MKPLPFTITQKAVYDLEDIWYYTFQNWSVEQADRYHHLIFEEIRYIRSNPKSGRSIEQIRKGYRVTKVKSHLIFYRVINDTIEIIRILHERMDIENRLND
jgi:toxin ParE1/3/4